MLAGSIGLVCFAMLSTYNLSSPFVLVALLFGVNLSVASPGSFCYFLYLNQPQLLMIRCADVMVDGIIAERSRYANIFYLFCYATHAIYSCM